MNDIPEYVGKVERTPKGRILRFILWIAPTKSVPWNIAFSYMDDLWRCGCWRETRKRRWQ